MQDNDRELLEVLGRNIRFLRHAQGFSQESFAPICGINRAYLGRIERGEQNISTLNLIKIARALGVSVGKLFKGIK